MHAPITVTDESLLDTTKQHPLVVVDFWAAWCGPCRVLGPVIERLASEYGNQVTFAKLDVDRNPGMASRFRVQSIPALVFFRNGNVVDRTVGALPYTILKQKVDQLLADSAVSPTAA